MFSSSFFNENLIIGLMTLKYSLPATRIGIIAHFQHIVSRVTAKCEDIRRIFLLDFDKLEDKYGESVNRGNHSIV